MCNRQRDEPPGTRLAGIAVCVCLLFASTAHAQSPFDIGISVHLAGNPGMLPSSLSLISQAGANSVRDDVPWDQVERLKGQLAMPSGVDNLVNQALKANVQAC